MDDKRPSMLPEQRWHRFACWTRVRVGLGHERRIVGVLVFRQRSCLVQDGGSSDRWEFCVHGRERDLRIYGGR